MTDTHSMFESVESSSVSRSNSLPGGDWLTAQPHSSVSKTYGLRSDDITMIDHRPLTKGQGFFKLSTESKSSGK